MRISEDNLDALDDRITNLEERLEKLINATAALNPLPHIEEEEELEFTWTNGDTCYYQGASVEIKKICRKTGTCEIQYLKSKTKQSNVKLSDLTDDGPEDGEFCRGDFVEDEEHEGVYVIVGYGDKPNTYRLRSTEHPYKIINKDIHEERLTGR